MKHVVITGAAGGIGKEICLRYADEGYFVHAVYHSDFGNLEELLAGRGKIYQADISTSADVKRIFEEMNFKELDVLVNCAGVAIPIKLLIDTSDDEMEKVFDVNVKGTYYMCREFIPKMLDNADGGCIINISSMWGLSGASCEALYAASKAAIISLTKSLAKEYAFSGIRVNAIAPGFVDTEMNKGFSKSDRNQILEDSPLSRFCDVKEVADACVFLSEKAKSMTGDVLNLSNGMVIT